MSDFSDIITPMQNDEIFSALANPIRRRLLEILIKGPMTAGGLAAKFSLSRPAVSEHLAVLRRAGLVLEEQSGRERIYSLNVVPMQSIKAWLLPFELYWQDRLTRLAKYMENNDQ